DLDRAGRNFDLPLRAHDRITQVRHQPALNIQREHTVPGVANPLGSLDLEKSAALDRRVKRIPRDSDPARLKRCANRVWCCEHPFSRAERIDTDLLTKSCWRRQDRSSNLDRPHHSLERLAVLFE